MKRLSLVITLCVAWISMFAQGFSDQPKPVKNMLKTAEMDIKDFHCDSIIAAYPVYNIFRKKEFKDKRFDKIPTFKELEQYLDFKHPVLGNILVKTTDGEVWLLMGKPKDVDDFAYTKGSDKDKSFFSYLEKMKPDKIYSLFGQGFMTFEKDGKLQLYSRKREEVDLPELYKQMEYDLDHFNRFDFPRNKKTPLMIDYGK